MIVAIPLGLMSAIFLTQYAPIRACALAEADPRDPRRRADRGLRLFRGADRGAGVRDFGLSIGVSSASSESALAAGLVMGIMIIPFVSSMADDSIAAVPQAMRDGSLALGATKSETIKKVLLPAALPGVVGGILLAVSRAIGETMIVVMAAGLAANMTANPFESVTTVTTQIVQLLTGDQEFDSAKTLAAFALGLALFLITLSSTSSRCASCADIGKLMSDAAAALTRWTGDDDAGARRASATPPSADSASSASWPPSACRLPSSLSCWSPWGGRAGRLHQTEAKLPIDFPRSDLILDPAALRARRRSRRSPRPASKACSSRPPSPSSAKAAEELFGGASARSLGDN